MIFDRFEGHVCGCCARSAVGYGYHPKFGAPILYTCDDPECLEVAKNTYTLPQEQFSRLESLAAGKGGEAGGQFLDQVGKTDLSQLTPDEWHEFLRRVIAGYRVALKTTVRDEAPF